MQSGEDDHPVVIINIKHQQDTFQVDVPQGSTVLSLKHRISDLMNDAAPPRQRLIHNGRTLKDAEFVDDFEDKTLYLVKAAVGSGTDQLASSASDIPVGLMKDESSSFMKNMMKNPFMEQLLSNPVVMKSMMTSNPQLKKLCEENPELEHALQDPATLQEMMKAMSNPEYHKEMMKNNDRIMSNIEMLPEGFNALRKVYTTIQEPLMEGLDEANMAKLKSDAQAIEQLPPARRLVKEPIPNPWASSNTSVTSSFNMSKGPTIKARRSPPVAPLPSIFEQFRGLKTASSPDLSQASLPQRSSSVTPPDYESKLNILESMGFLDRQENMTMLRQSFGNLQLTIEKLVLRSNEASDKDSKSDNNEPSESPSSSPPK